MEFNEFMKDVTVDANRINKGIEACGDWYWDVVITCTHKPTKIKCDKFIKHKSDIKESQVASYTQMCLNQLYDNVCRQIENNKIKEEDEYQKLLSRIKEDLNMN